ncbi:MAG: lactate utilization protein C [Myxococcota bacterium]
MSERDPVSEGAREQILRAVRSATLGRREHPGPYVPAPTPPAPATGALPGAWEAFRSAATAAGAHVLGPVSRAEAARAARERVAQLGSGRCVAEPAAVEMLGAGPWQVAAGAPREFADVSLAIARGAFGVCENGAILLTADLAPHRSLWVLCEHLWLLIEATDLVADMHEAVARISARGLSTPHSVWVAGPSKTADIEQALVEGAHGPRSLWVVGVV